MNKRRAFAIVLLACATIAGNALLMGECTPYSYSTRLLELMTAGIYFLAYDRMLER